MGKKFLAEVETDEYYNVEIKPVSKLDYVSKNRIRDLIKELEEKEEKNYNLTGLITECEIKIETLKELLEE